MKLSTNNVISIFDNCLSNKYTKKENILNVKSVNFNIKFDLEKILKNTNDINSMINELPNNFKENIGGGWSFLNIIINNKGEIWTSEHIIADKLVSLGLATNKLSFLLEKDVWKILPGGMPYIIIHDIKKDRRKKINKIRNL